MGKSHLAKHRSKLEHRDFADTVNVEIVVREGMNPIFVSGKRKLDKLQEVLEEMRKRL